MKKTLLSAIFAGFLVFGGGFMTNMTGNFIVYAQGTNETKPEENSSSYDDFEGIIPSTEQEGKTGELAKRLEQGRVGLGDVFIMIIKLIDLVTKLAGTVAVLFLIYGGYQYMIGSVSDDKEGAKKTIQYAIMGLIVTFLAYVIVNLVKVQFLGF